MRLDPRRRSVLAIILGGLTCAVLLGLGGWAWNRASFGADDAASFARVEQEVQGEFRKMAAQLDRAARSEAAVAAGVLQAPDDKGIRHLFAVAASLIGEQGQGTLAITVYGTSRAGTTPIAWAGRPSDLPPQRINGPSALFVAPGPLGFRLVSTQPVVSGGVRVGAVAAERVFSEPAAVAGTARDRFTFETRLAVVSLRTLYEGAGEGSRPFSFLVRAPDGSLLLDAAVDARELQAVRAAFWRRVLDLVLCALALTLLLLCGSLLDRRALAHDRRVYLVATLGVAALILLSRALFWLATPPGDHELFSARVYSDTALSPLLRHPADFMLDALAALGLVALMAGGLERWRLSLRAGRRAVFGSARSAALFAVAQLGVGLGLAVAVLLYEQFLARTFHGSGIDLLYFSPHPWDAGRLAMQFGLLAFHAAFAWLAVLALRTALGAWRFPPGNALRGPTVVLCWGLPIGLALASTRGLAAAPIEALTLCSLLALGVLVAPRGLARLRRASQGFRLVVMFLALLAPAFAVYPSLVGYEQDASRRTVETSYGPEALNQLDNLQRRLDEARREIDAREAELESFVSVPALPPGVSPPPESAFLIWRDTALERYRVSSAVELYNAAGYLVSRFALNLPEEASRQLWHEENCTWQTFGEISPFGAQDRQLLHAGRNICGPGGIIYGTIVIHVILDDSTLSFISSQNPYFELLRGERPKPREEAPGRELEFAVYGWSRTPLYVSGTNAWPLPDEVFQRVYASRRPFWTRLDAGGVDYEVYLENDRRGIYALGYPVIPFIGHAINLAELATLVALLYAAILLGAAAFRVLAHRRVRSGRALLREIRESFYRKLFLAFVAASVIPVVILALVTRAYIADRLRHDVESAAHKTTAIARRVIEEYTVLQPGGLASQADLSDDAMVGLSRVIGQDVNIFNGPRLVATSERDLFASGLLPMRTPADVYRAITLERLPSVITEEQAGDFRYMVAAAPVRAAGRDAILTVPLTLRQQEIEREIDDLNRRIVLAALLFILVGAAFGYPLAERIADPVSRLMRATRRIAKGDFDERIATTSSDELRRLVEAFNLMSAELRRQSVELERTHRLEAWAEMARQVAHEIKNPLTPIQLNAEHLRRVHADRGKPLEPVLDSCVDAILLQVRLLRQIASEFSSFASSPTPRIAPASLRELIDEVVRPYVVGAGDSVHFDVQVPHDLPPVAIDRTLVGRALTNVVDNALHAMPAGGRVTLRAAIVPPERIVELTVDDTGVGMEPEALARLFEPYFSTKAVGTGLGLAIARRNIQLNHGTIAVSSQRGAGTQVRITLPVAEEPAARAEAKA